LDNAIKEFLAIFRGDKVELLLGGIGALAVYLYIGAHLPDLSSSTVIAIVALTFLLVLLVAIEWREHVTKPRRIRVQLRTQRAQQKADVLQWREKIDSLDQRHSDYLAIMILADLDCATGDLTDPLPAQLADLGFLGRPYKDAIGWGWKWPLNPQAYPVVQRWVSHKGGLSDENAYAVALLHAKDGIRDDMPPSAPSTGVIRFPV